MNPNPQQLRAIESGANELFVVAGPGSGKTFVLDATVRRRIADGIDPKRIAVLTFTNGGAKEFSNRLAGVKLGYIGTLHSFCFRLIRQFGTLIGYVSGSVSILPAEDKEPRLLEVAKDLGCKLSKTKLLARELPEAQLVWREYEFRLKANNLADYDIILRDGLVLLALEQVRAKLQLDELFVDEVQDSAAIDWAIYDMFPAKRKFFVGDGDQSIFAFRGARPDLLVSRVNNLSGSVESDHAGSMDERVRNKLPDAVRATHSVDESTMNSGSSAPPAQNTLPAPDRNQSSPHAAANGAGDSFITLEQNYRSDIAICRAATALIAHNTDRVPKAVVPVSQEEGNINVGCYETAMEEMGTVAIKAQRCFSPLSRDYSAAILYRTNYHADQMRLFAKGMGITVAQSVRPDMPVDWKKALLLLSMCVSPDNDTLAEKYLVVCCGLSVSEVRQRKLNAQANTYSLSSVLKRKEWPTELEQLPQLFGEHSISHASVNLIRERARLLQPDAGIADLLHDLYSHDTQEEAADDTGLFIGTYHSAKGREFDVVFCPSFEEGIMPSPRGELEEERRLAFVAITRARYQLYLSYCQQRRERWGNETVRPEPSRFLKEMGL